MTSPSPGHLFNTCSPGHLPFPRDVLTVSKRLAKEREEMCRELGRLHDNMIELHDNMILEMQVTILYKHGSIMLVYSWIFAELLWLLVLQVMSQENANLRKAGEGVEGGTR